jgi:hypothetical protein
MHAANAEKQESPAAMLDSTGSQRKALVGRRTMKGGDVVYMAIEKERKKPREYRQLAEVFRLADEYRKSIADRIKVETPDEFMNTVGGAMAIAADACWEEPTWMHGAVAWRKRLNGWRAAYMGDALGWHDRARTHFRAYCKSQIASPESGKACPGEVENLTREAKTRESLLYSSGYISPDPDGKITMLHYDMNLVYIDALLWHLLWTGDVEFAREMWPVLERHLAWEKRCFDANDDGLYDAYCCIWASDAVQYSGGDATHSTAYNFRANAIAARIAKMIGKDGTAYEKEAGKILRAMREKLWLRDKGWFAEYRDAMGEQRLHEAAAIWTVYHTIDSNVPSDFELYQMLRYVDNEIPHLPVEGDGVPEGLAVVSTTNWAPYTWSVNNVAMAEIAHTALSYWQGGRCEEAYRLWKGTVVDLMYMSSCPGNFGQISWLDAYRGELYSDFSDVVGICSRALVEGLFGIVPDALAGELLIRPGMPQEWDKAKFETPDVKFKYERKGQVERFVIETRLPRAMKLRLKCAAKMDSVAGVSVNGKRSDWQPLEDAVGRPAIEVCASAADKWEVVIEWKGDRLVPSGKERTVVVGEKLIAQFAGAKATGIYDPQHALEGAVTGGDVVSGVVRGQAGHRTVFARLEQGEMRWWEAIDFEIAKERAVAVQKTPALARRIDMVDLRNVFNDDVTRIFENEYLSPRPKTVTLQLPKNGVGNWCKYDIHPEIYDGGLRAAAGSKGWIAGPDGISLATPEIGKNVVYTSLWDNYPDSVKIPLGGKAKQVYLMMVGSTNAMQSRFLNGQVLVCYRDGSRSALDLRNPETWWPIQEDYLVDDYAFAIDGELPWRVRLKTGEIYKAQKSQGGRQIPGGCATVLEMALDGEKELESLTVAARANDVVIGLMSLTLVRD